MAALPAVVGLALLPVLAPVLLVAGCSDEPLQPVGGPAPAVQLTGQEGYRAVTFRATVADATGVEGLRSRSRLGGEGGVWTEWAQTDEAALELTVPTGRGAVVADVEVRSVTASGDGPVVAGTGTSQPIELDVSPGARRDAGRVVVVTGAGLADGPVTVEYVVEGCPAAGRPAACEPPADSVATVTDGRVDVRDRTWGGPGRLGVTARQTSVVVESPETVGGWS